MSMEITNNYGNYATQYVGNDNSKKKEVEKTEDKTVKKPISKSGAKSTAE